MSFAFLLVAVDLVAPDDAREPAPLVLAWGGRVVRTGLSARLRVDNGKPVITTTGGHWPGRGQAVDKPK